MTLAAFFEALSNVNATVTVQDGAKHDLVKVNAAGYEQLLSELLAETVKEINIVSAMAVTVVLDTEVSA